MDLMNLQNRWIPNHGLYKPWLYMIFAYLCVCAIYHERNVLPVDHFLDADGPPVTTWALHQAVQDTSLKACPIAAAEVNDALKKHLMQHH